MNMDSRRTNTNLTLNTTYTTTPCCNKWKIEKDESYYCKSHMVTRVNKYYESWDSLQHLREWSDHRKNII